MTQALGRLRILLVDPDDLLAADAEALAHPEIEFLTLTRAATLSYSVEDRDVVVMQIDTPAALDLLAAFCARENAPVVIALAGRSWPGRPLEFVLTLAEL